MQSILIGLQFQPFFKTPTSFSSTRTRYDFANITYSVKGRKTRNQELHLVHLHRRARAHQIAVAEGIVHTSYRCPELHVAQTRHRISGLCA